MFKYSYSKYRKPLPSLVTWLSLIDLFRFAALHFYTQHVVHANIFVHMLPKTDHTLFITSSCVAFDVLGN